MPKTQRKYRIIDVSGVTVDSLGIFDSIDAAYAAMYKHYNSLCGHADVAFEFYIDVVR
jgi:hypothetical protein